MRIVFSIADIETPVFGDDLESSAVGVSELSTPLSRPFTFNYMASFASSLPALLAPHDDALLGHLNCSSSTKSCFSPLLRTPHHCSEVILEFFHTLHRLV